MVESDFKEAFSEEWVKQNITDCLNELVILRRIVPWQRLVNHLSGFYRKGKGRKGKPIRMMIALLIMGKLRLLSDAGVVGQVKENRYIQYFCNVPDKGLQTFLNPSTLCTFRRRLGVEGLIILEKEVFNFLLRCGVIENDAQLMDSTVMEDNILYPTDVLLLHKAFGKMQQFAENNEIPLWWDEAYLKKRWRAYGLAKKEEKVSFLWEFYLLFLAGLKIFRLRLVQCDLTYSQRQKGHALLDLLSLLDSQTRQKVSGETHIENRIVSLDYADARPVKKGKSHPACEFGTTLQVSFNRQGFMVTVENFIGQPGDKTLYLSTVELYRKRMKEYPEFTVTDLGYRSRDNFKDSKVKYVFMGRSEDVPEEKQDYCRRARSATEGFIAVAKNWRGFRRSLYRGFDGDKIWTRLCQIAHHLKKFLQLYQEEAIKEESLVKLGLLPA